MADTDDLRTYDAQAYPTLPGSEARFISEELERLAQVIEAIVTATQALEARIETLENA